MYNEIFLIQIIHNPPFPLQLLCIVQNNLKTVNVGVKLALHSTKENKSEYSVSQHRKKKLKINLHIMTLLSAIAMHRVLPAIARSLGDCSSLTRATC